MNLDEMLPKIFFIAIGRIEFSLPCHYNFIKSFKVLYALPCILEPLFMMWSFCKSSITKGVECMIHWRIELKKHVLPRFPNPVFENLYSCFKKSSFNLSTISSKMSFWKSNCSMVPFLL